MPSKTIRASVTVPAEYATEAHENFDQAIDQLVIHNAPVSDSEVVEECADTPKESEEE